MLYRPRAVDEHESRVRKWVICCDDADEEIFFDFDGSPRASNWKPIAVRFIRTDGERAVNQFDFPWLGAHALAMRPRAVDRLRRLLEANGEILPLAAEDGTELFVLNVTRVLDALDEERSEIVWHPKDSNHIVQIKTLAFLDPVVQGVDIFRLPIRTFRGGPTYLSDRFVEAVKKSQLSGLTFTRVWPPPK